jgi:hypothetical protein
MHGIVREKLAGSDEWTTILDYNPPTAGFLGINFNTVAISPAGDVYVGGSNWGSSWEVLKRPAGQSSFVVAEQVTGGTLADLAIDSAGNVFTTGETTVQVTVTSGKKTTIRNERRWTVHKQPAGQSNFTTVNQLSNPSNLAYSMTTVDSGQAAGVYVVGQGCASTGTSNHWIVRKGTNGGTTWTTVDDFVVDPSGLTIAQAVTSDIAGNLYVAGEAMKRTLVGMTKQKQPIYSFSYEWLVRKSIDGGASWFTDASIGTAGVTNEAFNMGCDASGNVYAVSAHDNAAIIRSNAGGGWHTVDVFQLAPGKEAHGYGFAVAPDGSLYASGYAFDAAGTVHAFVRSTSASTPVSAANTFSSEEISASAEERLKFDEGLLMDVLG